jgi:hypothetical protein
MAAQALFVHVAGAATAQPQRVDDFLYRNVVLDRRQLKHAVNVVDPDDVRSDAVMVSLELFDDPVPVIQFGPDPKLVDVELQLSRQLEEEFH